MKPSPSSPLDRHQYILLLRISSASEGQWAPDTQHSGPQSILQRVVNVEAVVREVLKTPRERHAPTLKLQIKQREPANHIRAEDYGPWSEVDLAPGIELLIFANDPIPGATIERTLAEGTGLIVKVPSLQVPFAVEDVKRALEWEKSVGRSLLDSGPIRSAISDARAKSGPLLASHLVESLAGADLNEPKTAQALRFLIELLRSPESNERFRLVILNYEVNALLMEEAPPLWFRAQLVRAMLDLLAEDKATLLHDPIRQAYLVNVVFDAKGQQLVAAHDVLATDVARSTYESVILRRGFEGSKQAQLIAWLRAR